MHFFTKKNNKNLKLAIQEASHYLKLKPGHKILPATTNRSEIYAIYQDESKQVGESFIPDKKKSIVKIGYQTEICLDDEVLCRISESDLIIFGPGSLFTSVLPVAIIPDISKAIKKSFSRKVFICNVFNQIETAGMTTDDHVNTFCKLSNLDILDDIIINNNFASDDKRLVRPVSFKSLKKELNAYMKYQELIQRMNM